MEINFFGNLYTLLEIAINNNFDFNELQRLTKYRNNEYDNELLEKSNCVLFFI